METTGNQRTKVRAEYYREWRAKKRAKAAEAVAETSDIKADFRAALNASVALQKAVSSREETIRHLEKMVELLSADLCARLERIETALQVKPAVPHPAPHPVTQPSQPSDLDHKPAPPWMKR